MFEDPTGPRKQQQLGQELKELTSTEQALDQLIQSCSLNFKHLTEDKANKKYPLWLGGGCQGVGTCCTLTSVQSWCSGPLRAWRIRVFLSGWLLLLVLLKRLSHSKSKTSAFL